jgi:hypothetical protein
MQIEITGPSKSGRAANARILIIPVRTRRWNRARARLHFPGKSRQFSAAHWLKMKMAALKGLRPVVIQLPD